VGYEKPHATFFEMALQAAGTPPAATCFVDDLPRNIEAGMSLGIRGYLIDRWQRHPHSPLPRIETLDELLPALGI
jgi:FMN phosphatase YigB (HAD superfamily)